MIHKRILWIFNNNKKYVIGIHAVSMFEVFFLSFMRVYEYTSSASMLNYLLIRLMALLFHYKGKKPLIIELRMYHIP
jgi:hypothetical protein